VAHAPTAQQAAFLTALSTGRGHLALVARAGSGKTSTILLGVAQEIKQRPRNEQLICAFNKAIAKEVGEKLKAAGHDWRAVQAKTAHALGFGLLRQVFEPEVEEKKVARLVEDRAAGDNAEHSVWRQYPSQIVDLVGYAKQAGFGFFPDLAIHNVAAWHHLADHYDVNGLDDTSEAEMVVDAAIEIYRASLLQTNVVDYDDMILFPLVKNLRVKYQKDVIYVDEAQDLSAARQALIRKFLKPNGRMIVVGDDRQAIYGFTGADAAALPNMISQLGARELPLSVTWRCPRAVVELAQALVPDIEAAPGAAEGTITHVYGGSEQGKKDLEALLGSVGPTDAILCRNTAPLIATAYKLIRAGKPCKVEGRAIGEGLIALARRWKVQTISALLGKLELYREREIQKAQAKGNDQKVEEVQDRVGTLEAIANACIEQGKTAVADVVVFISNLFADGAENVTILATYHRSKGREWPRVILWEDAARCPSRAARQQWQLEQEANLKYVAFTRAMSELVFVEGVA
jgi:superfamily I DNA/RNA helicase